MSQAMLIVVSSGKFAYLSNSKGSPYVVWSKQHANFMITSGVDARVITPHDALELRLAVQASPLPDTDEHVSRAMIDAITRINEEIHKSLGAGTPVALEEKTISACIERFERHYAALNN